MNCARIEKQPALEVNHAANLTAFTHVAIRPLAKLKDTSYLWTLDTPTVISRSREHPVSKYRATMECTVTGCPRAVDRTAAKCPAPVVTTEGAALPCNLVAVTDVAVHWRPVAEGKGAVSSCRNVAEVGAVLRNLGAERNHTNVTTQAQAWFLP
ncbi:hypothetical protein CEXT_15341 [Caerostris extrusa]|uniref:Uncharacterized protein n=1 Tax=Caerostris extrusa TaxID=172846 RepID=A0AAV4WH43_CAEEX|nr:hypothetical protein CEXT_15341 [Caerostris extrusa]